MKQTRKMSFVDAIFFVFIVLLGSYLYSCNDRKVAASVASTLTAQPTATLKPTNTPKLTSTPSVTPTLLVVSSRTDLLGLSFDYMISELKKIGFEFEIKEDNYGNRNAYGKYISNKMYDVELQEEGHSLVSISYEYGYGIFTEDNLNTPGFDNVAKLVFGDKIYTEVVEPWYLEGGNRINNVSVSDRVLCFDGYVIWHTHYYELDLVDIKILIERYYRDLIEDYYGNNPPFEQCE